jgi:hypothetical protein
MPDELILTSAQTAFRSLALSIQHSALAVQVRIVLHFANAIPASTRAVSPVIFPSAEI